jgi:hypothetical protein
VPANVKLWKGLFSDSLPGFIKEMDAKDPNGKFMINYLHVDCDLYVGALSKPGAHFAFVAICNLCKERSTLLAHARNRCTNLCRCKGRVHNARGPDPPRRPCGFRRGRELCSGRLLSSCTALSTPCVLSGDTHGATLVFLLCSW